MYRHTQRSWGILVFAGSLAALLGAISLSRRVPGQGTPVLLSSTIPLLGMLLFHSLTVIVDDEWIHIRFGPGLIRKQVRLADVAACAPFRYPWWWGWGIRYPWWWGWLFSVSGLDAVEIKMKDGHRIGIGTDQPQALCDAIRDRVPR